MNLPEVGWESLGARFKNYPFYNLDNYVSAGSMYHNAGSMYHNYK